MRPGQIVSASIDMNAGFPRLVEENLPGCRLAYDLFHVMQMLRQNVYASAKAASISRARKKYRDLPKKGQAEEARRELDR